MAAGRECSSRIGPSRPAVSGQLLRVDRILLFGACLHQELWMAADRVKTLCRPSRPEVEQQWYCRRLGDPWCQECHCLGDERVAVNVDEG